MWRSSVLVITMFNLCFANDFGRIITFGSAEDLLGVPEPVIAEGRHTLSYLYPVYHKNVSNFDALFKKYYTGEGQEVFAEFKKAAESPDPEIKAVAYYMMGILIVAKRVGEEDFSDALNWFNKAYESAPETNAGILAHYFIENASFFLEGKEYVNKINPILDQLKKLFEEETDVGDKFRLSVQVGLISMLVTQIEESIDYFDKALDYFDKVPQDKKIFYKEEYGVVTGSLGTIYFNGMLVPRNLEKAKKYLELGAQYSTHRPFIKFSIEAMLAAIAFERARSSYVAQMKESKILKMISSQGLDIFARALAREIVYKYNVFNLFKTAEAGAWALA